MQKQCSGCKKEYPATTEYFAPSPKCKFGLYSYCRMCHREKSRIYRESHRDEDIARQRRFRQEHLEECRTREREYARAHREQSNARVKKWRQENPERVRDSWKAYYAANADKRREASSKWFYENLERSRQTRKDYYQRVKHQDQHKQVALSAYRNRKARKRSAQGSHSADDVALLLRSQKGLCWWCGKPVDQTYHVDHRIPLARGGSNAPENLCISCPTCNLRKNDKLPQEWNGRLL